MKIIDFRVRPPLKSFTRLSIYTNTWLKGLFGFHGAAPDSARHQSMSMLRSEMSECGVVKSVVWGRAVDDTETSTTNDDVSAIVRDNRDIFAAGFAGVCLRGTSNDAVAHAVEEVERALVALDLKGITIEPMFGMKPSTHPNDEKLYPIYERCERLGGILGLTVCRGSGSEQDLNDSDPVHVDRVARSFPNLVIVVSHAFWPWVNASCALAFRRNNVYLLPDMYGAQMPGHSAWVELANTVAPEKILFGSAYPVVGIKELVAAYKTLPYRSEEIRHMVMYGNAARLLGLDKTNEIEGS